MLKRVPKAAAPKSRSKIRSSDEGPVAVAILGAGAPNSPLMAGALAHIYQRGKTFDRFYTSGGGALMGLLFVAPGRISGQPPKPPDDALRDVVEFGVDDRIYKLFPIGYKTFFKRGWFTEQIHDFADALKADVKPRPLPGQPTPPGYDPKSQRRRRLYNDAIDFLASTVTPPRLGPTSLGLCEPLPFLERLIDFETANSPTPPSGLDVTKPVVIAETEKGEAVVLRSGWFFVNAYNLTKKRMDYFSNHVPENTVIPAPSKEQPDPIYAGPLTAQTTRAALSFPFIYPPQKIGHGDYCEGALVDPLNLPNAIRTIARTQKGPVPDGRKRSVRFYLFDILGALETQLMYTQRTLWEAFGLSILTPIISLAKKDRVIFEHDHKELLVPVCFTIPPQRRDCALEWSYGNMTALWDAGWDAGKAFVDKYKDDLPDRRPH